ncbi:excinuclease ABC subunit UvrB, partial [Agrobacterium sp. a22-2]|nr:excinuclease ABC subunit UvrB [Agrobacterium sp. a22-2]
TPDLRSAPPPQGAGKASYFAKPDLDNMGPGTDMAVPVRREGQIPGRAEGGRDTSSLFRKNTLDEMTVGRTEKPVPGKLPDKPKPGVRDESLLPARGEKVPGRVDEGQAPPSEPPSSGPTRGSTSDPKPIIRAKSGVGSYEDAGDVKRQKKTKGKTGRPGR